MASKFARNKKKSKSENKSPVEAFVESASHNVERNAEISEKENFTKTMGFTLTQGDIEKLDQVRSKLVSLGKIATRSETIRILIAASDDLDASSYIRAIERAPKVRTGPKKG